MLLALCLLPLWVWAGDAARWETLMAAGRKALDAGHYTEALRQYTAALDEAQDWEGDLRLAVTLNRLGMSHYYGGQYAEAEPLYQHALAIREAALGSEHPSVATSFDNLAVLYGKQGRYAEAEPRFKRALAIREAALGSEHPDFATGLNNLAVLHDEQGRYAEAEPLFKRTLAIQEKALGGEDPDVAVALNNLGLLYSKQGRYAEAELLFKRALAIVEKALEPEHPHVLLGLTNIAGVYKSQDQAAKALIYSCRGTKIARKRFFRDTPDLSEVRMWEQRSQRGLLLRHLTLLHAAKAPCTSQGERLAEAFETLQFAHDPRRGEEVAQMALRLSTEDAALQEKVRAFQDTRAYHRKLEGDLLGSYSQAAETEQREALRQRLGETEARLNALVAELRGYEFINSSRRDMPKR